MLTGQAKIDYQREYMRRRRSNRKVERSNKIYPSASEIALDPSVAMLDPVTPRILPGHENTELSVTVRPPLTKERQLSQKGFNE